MKCLNYLMLFEIRFPGIINSLGRKKGVRCLVMTQSLSVADHYDLSQIISALPSNRFKIDDKETYLSCLIPRLHPRDVTLNPFRLRACLYSQVIISYTDRKTRKDVIVAKRSNQGGLHPAMLNRWIQQYIERKFSEKPEDLYYKHFLKSDPWTLRPSNFRITFTDVEDDAHRFDVVIDEHGTQCINVVALERPEVRGVNEDEATS